MEQVLKLLTENFQKVWEERKLISLHRPIFVAFGLVVCLLTGATVGLAEYAWFSNSITSRDNEIRIKNATIENLQSAGPPRLATSSQTSARDWGTLSTEEIAGLCVQFRSWAKQDAIIFSADSDCADLAESFSELFSGLDSLWDMDSTALNGLVLAGSDSMTKAMANAFEGTTKGRLLFKLTFNIQLDHW